MAMTSLAPLRGRNIMGHCSHMQTGAAQYAHVRVHVLPPRLVLSSGYVQLPTHDDVQLVFIDPLAD